MNRRIVLRKDKEAGGSENPPVFQPYLSAEDLIASEGPSLFWTCVRTRPRWEKKFVGWLREKQKHFFLPIFPHVTISGRKRRLSELPLFPGFVFVEGKWTKKDFSRSGMVVYVLQPRGDKEALQLHSELRNIWVGLTSGLYVAPVHNLAVGEVCRIVRGPLQGVEAKFERMGREGRLILQVEMMGGGIAVEVPVNDVEAGA